ncbi:MAG: hypothetical protein NC548_15695 [Lachnospiraceae bacterium]|nr:hypothetical protein [Lachnospiraceae bacterium]
MKILPDGSTMFDDIYDLTYNLLNSIGISIDNTCYLYDQDTSTHIDFQGRHLKCSVNPNIPCFAGQGEVVFDLMNVRQMATMLGYAITKEEAQNPQFKVVSHYISEFPNDKKCTAINLKMMNGDLKSTNFYYNKCLKFIAAIFLVYDEVVNLSNFDSIPER